MHLSVRKRVPLSRPFTAVVDVSFPPKLHRRRRRRRKVEVEVDEVYNTFRLLLLLLLRRFSAIEEKQKRKKCVQKGKLLAPLSFSFSPHFSTLPVCAHIGAPLSAMMVAVVVVKNGREKSAGRRFGSIGVRCCCDCGDHYSFTSSFSRTLQQKTTTTLDKVFCCRRCFFLQTNVQMSTFVFVCGGGESGDQTR